LARHFSLHKVFFLAVVLWLIPEFAGAQFYYGLFQNFGKNRVQYNEFNWTYYRYEQFDVYFYKGGKPMAQKASVMTPEAHATLFRSYP
jgi:hypothetical protein